MKLILDVPEWATDKHISIFAGMELIAALPFGSRKLRVKKFRCNWCGKCCESCSHLKKIGRKIECDLGIDRPFRCCSGDPCFGTPVPNECNITYEEVDILD